MSRTLLLGTAAMSAVLLAGSSHAQTIYGGGSTLGGPVYTGKVFPEAGITNIDYYLVGSGTGICAFVDNTAAPATSPESCKGYAATESGSNPPLPPTGATISFGASDAAITSANVTDFANKTGGHQIIQVPAFGTPVAIPFNISGKTTNGSVNLTNNDLCGIFSGKYTNWNQVSSKPTTGPITVVYRADGSGTTFLTTNHLSAICTKGSNSNITFTATTTFASLFTTVPSNFIGATGSGGVATAVAAHTDAVGYVGPDYTLETKASCGGTGQPACKPVASINGVAPTTANTTAALSSVTFTVSATNPLSFDPTSLFANPKTGYPIVGYTNVLFSSAYKTANQVTTVTKWADCLYNVTGKTCTAIVSNLATFGFVPVSGVTASAAPSGSTLAAQVVKSYFSGSSSTVPIVVASNGR